MGNYMGNKKFSKENIAVAVIFLLFACFMFLQFSKVAVCYDDYGYLSLTYGVNTPHLGTSFSFPELLSFLKDYYQGANGRVLYAFLWLSAFKVGGLTLVRMLAAVSLTAIVYLFYRLAGRNSASPIASALMLCLFYGLIGLVIHRQGTYWYAAFFYYTTPLIPLLLFCVILLRHIEGGGGISVRKVVGLSVLVILSAFSTEQFGVATASLIAMLAAYDFYRNKRAVWYHWLFLALSVVSAAFVIFSPGLMRRAASQNNAAFYKLSFFKKLTTNTKNLMNLFFYRENKWFLAVFFAALAVLGVVLFIGDTKRYHKILDVILCIPCAVISATYIFPGLAWQDAILTSRITALMIFLLLTLIVFEVTRFYWNSGRVLPLMLFYMSVLSIACLVVSPELPPRILIPFLLLSFVLMAFIFTDAIHLFTKYRIAATCLILIPLVVFSIRNAANIYIGYAQNDTVHKQNDITLQDASARIAQGEKISEITLQKLPLPLYSCDMVYQEGFEFMKWWMDSYYKIPHDIKLIYR